MTSVIMESYTTKNFEANFRNKFDGYFFSKLDRFTAVPPFFYNYEMVLLTKKMNTFAPKKFYRIASKFYL